MSTSTVASILLSSGSLAASIYAVALSRRADRRASEALVVPVQFFTDGPTLWIRNIGPGSVTELHWKSDHKQEYAALLPPLKQIALAGYARYVALQDVAPELFTLTCEYPPGVCWTVRPEPADEWNGIKTIRERRKAH